jgi:hypothetical protein
MGHYCRFCGRERPNEQFSGKGHKIHICKRCQAKPKSERQAIADMNVILGFMQQSHISERNIVRLNKMTRPADTEVANLAEIVLKVAKVKPYRRKRLKFLARNHPDLIRKLEEADLIPARSIDVGIGEVFDEEASPQMEEFYPPDSLAY